MQKNVQGEVAYLFKNCPKPDGWFGCFFATHTLGRVALTGVTHISLCKGMKLIVDVEKDPKEKDVYIAKRVSLERSDANAMLYLQGISSAAPILSKILRLAQAYKKPILDMILHEPHLLGGLFPNKAALDEFVAEVTYPIAYDEVKAEFPKLKSNVINNLIEKYKGHTLSVLRQDPYKPLFAEDKVHGYTWNQAEMIAVELGLPMNGKSRIYSAIAVSVVDLHEKFSQVCIDINDPQNYSDIVSSATQRLSKHGAPVSVSHQDIQDAVSVPDSPLVCEERNGHVYVYTRRMRNIEDKCVQSVIRLVSEEDFVTPFIESKLDIADCINEFEQQSPNKLDNGQFQAVVDCLTSRMSILCGGPGCGKTATIACIIYCWHKLTGGHVSLSAPTWMAVKRTRESVDKSHVWSYDADNVVKTVASRVLSGFCGGSMDYPDIDPLMPEDGYWNGHGEPPKGEHFVLAIIDESSMVSLEQAAKLLELYENAQIIWVGDANQLPSINPGDFFGDLCRSRKVTCSTLRTNHRAHSRVIVDNSRKVLNGCAYGPMAQESGVFTFTEFKPYNGRTTAACAEYIADRYLQYLAAGYKMEDVAILAPMKKGIYFGSVIDLNVRIQNKLNPVSTPVFHRQGYKDVCLTKGYPIPSKEVRDSCSNEVMPGFRVGDKVVCVRNRPKKGRVNGDMGIIVEYGVPDEGRYYTQQERNQKKNHRYMKIEMFDGTTVEIVDEDFGDFELGYATTVHKSQGTGYRVILFSAQHEPTQWELDFLTRKLFYTAITRAEDVVELIGSLESVNHAINTPAAARFSLLPVYLDESLATHWDGDMDETVEDVYVDERYLM